MTYEEEFTALVEKIKEAKADDHEKLAAWKKANEHLTNLGKEMTTLISRATSVKD